MARKNMPASHYSMGDGPASQVHRHGRPASSSVHTRNSTKRWTALSNAMKNTTAAIDDKSHRRTWAPADVEAILGSRHNRDGDRHCRREPEGDKEGDSFENSLEKRR